MYNIFISYTRNDAILRHLINFHLIQYNEIDDVFYDKKDFIGNIDEAKKQKIKESNLLLVLVTKNCYSREKNNNYLFNNEIQDEITIANENNIHIVFFKEEEAPDIPQVIKDQRILTINFDPKEIEFGLGELNNAIEKQNKITLTLKSKNKIADFRDTILNKLHNFLSSSSDSSKRWMLSYITEDNIALLNTFVKSFQRQLNRENPEEVINSGFFYWSISSTRMWDSINSHLESTNPKHFKKRWDILKNTLKTHKYNYISLGVGAGGKDSMIIDYLVNNNAGLYYVPIDMSAPMLKIASKETFKSKIHVSNILPIEANFYDVPKNNDIKRLISSLTKGKPNLYSLLGNTLANSSKDIEKLGIIYDLMNEGDFLLLELSTIINFNKSSFSDIKDEYEDKEFAQFVLTTILNSTNLNIDMDVSNYYCEYEVSYTDNNKNKNIENEEIQKIINYFGIDINKRVKKGDAFIKDIKIKGFYKDDNIRGKKIVLSNWKSLDIKNKSSIKLLMFISRKYTPEGIDYLIEESNFTEIFRTPSKENLRKEKENTTNTLILLKKEE